MSFIFYNYSKAIRPLEATVEQNGAFWIKKDAKGDKINGCLKWTGSEIFITNYSEKLSVECQKELRFICLLQFLFFIRSCVRRR